MRVELLSTPSCSSHRPRSAFRAPSPSFTSLPSLSLQPPLVQAIFNRDVEEVRSLLNQKENINVLVSAAQPAAQAPTRLPPRFPAALGGHGLLGGLGWALQGAQSWGLQSIQDFAAVSCVSSHGLHRVKWGVWKDGAPIRPWRALPEASCGAECGWEAVG